MNIRFYKLNIKTYKFSAPHFAACHYFEQFVE